MCRHKKKNNDHIFVPQAVTNTLINLFRWWCLFFLAHSVALFPDETEINDIAKGYTFSTAAMSVTVL